MAQTSVHIMERHPVIAFDGHGCTHAYLHIKDAIEQTAAVTISVRGSVDRDLFADPLELAAQLEVAAEGLRAYAGRIAMAALADTPGTFEEGKVVYGRWSPSERIPGEMWTEPEFREAWGK